MYSLKSKLIKILDFIEDKNDVIYVDFPLHHNVDVPSSIIDNSYGKNTAYYELWTKDLEIASIWGK